MSLIAQDIPIWRGGTIWYFCISRIKAGLLIPGNIPVLVFELSSSGM